VENGRYQVIALTAGGAPATDGRDGADTPTGQKEKDPMSSMTLCHSDGCSGTTIVKGYKVYWTEGAGEAVIVHPDGRVERPDAQSKHEVLLMPEVQCVDTTYNRPMTPAEEAEWDIARYGKIWPKEEDTE
jgi:hypothetical protein